ncbi:DUF2510 domain-containing protein [Streptomyces sp. CA-132043]|uniref:DUF2510 domain-containing protein n=1 Tax=Streptomyces sp. CA-132043 TaxID=3240048 RepID=UPI003D91DD78
MTTPPGWYPDPGHTGNGPAPERWWDGSAWTEQTRAAQAAPAAYGSPDQGTPGTYGYPQQGAPGAYGYPQQGTPGPMAIRSSSRATGIRRPRRAVSAPAPARTAAAGSAAR